MYAESDEYQSLSFQDIRKKTASRTDTRTEDGQTDRQRENSIPPTHKQSLRGYNKKIFTKIYMQGHTMTDIVNHNRSTALERSVKILQCVCVCVCLGVGWWPGGGGGGGGGA